MHDNPVKRNGGQESVTRQFAVLQAVVVGNPEKISGGTWQASATALPPFVFQKRQSQGLLRDMKGGFLFVCHVVSGERVAKLK